MGDKTKPRPDLPVRRTMLPERTFLIGGILTLALGALLGAADALAGTVVSDPAFLEASVLLAGFGGFLLYVGWDARRHRLHLLALGDLDPPAGPG